MLLTSYIRSYLDIPVVLGIGLCQFNVITSLYLIDQIHDQPETRAVIEKLKDVLRKSSQEQDLFESKIISYHLYILKLDDKHRFLTLALHENNVIKSFRAKQLQQKLQENLNVSLQIFKELSSQRTILGQPILKSTQENIKEYASKSSNSNQNSQVIDSIENIQDILDALNTLSHFVSQYLGPKIVSNFWNLSRPQHEWLTQFDIKRSGIVEFHGASNSPIKPLHMLLLREWTQSFMKQCHPVIHDLPELFAQENLSQQHRKILSIYTSDHLRNHRKVQIQVTESLFGDTFL